MMASDQGTSRFGTRQSPSIATNRKPVAASLVFPELTSFGMYPVQREFWGNCSQRTAKSSAKLGDAIDSANANAVAIEVF
jgi:hypothetical protein